MTLASDIAGDHTEFDDIVETVSVTTYPGGNTVTGVKAVRGNLDTGSTSPGGVFAAESEAVPWSVWADELGNTLIQPGDRIIDSGNSTFVVSTSKRIWLNTGFYCLCHPLEQ